MSLALKIEAVSKTYPGARRGEIIHALREVSLDIRAGESFGLVGESGSGKTTLTRCIMALEPVGAGRILFEGRDIATLSRTDMQALRGRMQIVFQDPFASLNPRMSAHDIVAEPMVIHRSRLGLGARQRSDRVVALLERVGLGADQMHRLPHAFSGGQRQRIGIARALAMSPRLLVLDEPTSALDVSVQAQVLNLLHELQQSLQLTYLFISHDLGVIRSVCDRVALIHRGSIVEQGDCATVFGSPQSDYAKMLIGAMPDPDPDLSPFRTEKSPALGAA